MKDFFGRYLEVGDVVAFISHSRTSSRLRQGQIEGLTTYFVKVTYGPEGKYRAKVSPEKVVVRP